MLIALVAVTILVCAFQAMRSLRLLTSALWLAGTSALVALLIYLLGAPELAVIELSVGAGLVTILFVFAINIAGDQPVERKSPLPKPLALVLVVAAMAMLGGLSVSGLSGQTAMASGSSFVRAFWEDRSLDTLLQILFVFTAVLGVLGLLAEETRKRKEESKS